MGNKMTYSHYFRFQRIRPAFAAGPKFLLQSARGPHLLRLPSRLSPRPSSTICTRQLRLARRRAGLPVLLVGPLVPDLQLGASAGHADPGMSYRFNFFGLHTLSLYFTNC